MIRLDGHQVLEVRQAPDAQTMEDSMKRAQARVLQLAEAPTVDPNRLVVRCDPPYALVGHEGRDGQLKAEIAVDPRGASGFGLSDQPLAERYRDQLQQSVGAFSPPLGAEGG